MKIIEAEEDFIPLCPYCDKELDTIIRLDDQKSFFQGHLGYAYACPNCHRILGFADYEA